MTRLLLLSLAGVLSASCIDGTPPPLPDVAGGDAARGRAPILVYGCGACHVIPGIEEAIGTAGPPLTRWAERKTIAGSLPNDPENLVRWIRDPQSIEPGTAMPTMALTDREARDIAAYLYARGERRALGPPHPFPLDWLRGLGAWSEPKH